MKAYQQYLNEKFEEQSLNEYYFNPEGMEMMLNSIMNRGAQGLPENILGNILFAMFLGFFGLLGSTTGVFDAIKDFFGSLKNKTRGLVMGINPEKNIDKIQSVVNAKKSLLKPGEARYLETMKNKFVKAIQNKDREMVARLFDEIKQYKQRRIDQDNEAMGTEMDDELR